MNDMSGSRHQIALMIYNSIINMHIYTYTCRIHFDTIIKTSEDFFKKIYLSLYMQYLFVRGSWIPNRTATYWLPQPLRTSPCVVLVLLGCSTGGLGVQPLWDMFSFQHLLTNWSGLQTQSGVPKTPSDGWWLSLPQLVSNSSDLQLTDFLSIPSYIIVQSPTQSLEWHVWPSRRSIYNTSGQVHLPRMQCLINRDRHQHATGNGMDC